MKPSIDQLVPQPNSASACNQSSLQQPPAVQPEPQAASQAIMAIKQMLHGRRTTSLKAIYEAIHGPAGTTTEFCFRLQPEQSTAATSDAAGATSTSPHSHQRGWSRTAASQAIMATIQMQHGRRTTSLKAIYEAIHGPTGTTAEFCSRLQPEQSSAATSGAAGTTSSTHHSAIMATKEMQHGRRTTSLKAIYEAIHGPAGTTTEFCFRLQP
ncbi:hypothetical protein KR200_009541 [Drosophila serrata]|nr:hypothetical protein KR200_009541 [Drosophila serrata]